MSLLVRERPPLRLSVLVQTPHGANYRWGSDEWKPGNVLGSRTFSTVMPGGFDQASGVLARKPDLDYPDLEPLSTVTFSGVGGRVAWQGRLETSPRTSGDQMSVSPGLVGWQAHLDDDNSARMIALDCSLASWQGGSVQRQINLLGGGSPADVTDGSVSSDATTGQPALVTSLTGSWSRQTGSESWYDAKGIALGTLYYAWKLQATDAIGDDVATDSHWSWAADVSLDDVASAFETSGNLQGVGPTGTGSVAAADYRAWAVVGLNYDTSGGADGVTYPLYWTFLALTDNRGIPIRGTLTTTGGIGVLSSDIEACAVGTWAPKISYTTGPNGSVQPSSFQIPQAVFTDPTTAGAIVKAVTAYELRDWAVWEGPTYYSNARGARGNKWRARVGPSGLQETGPNVSRLFNGVIVQYTDVTGISRTVGPVASGATTIDSSLSDPDASNPANQAGIRRWSMLQAGTTTAPAAVQIGRLFLQEQKLVDTSGQAALVGYVLDDRGVMHPAWAVRAGDQISFTDAADHSYRRVVSSSWDDGSKTQQINLDAPPDGMQALLERLSVVLTPLGLS